MPYGSHGKMRWHKHAALNMHMRICQSGHDEMIRTPFGFGYRFNFAGFNSDNPRINALFMHINNFSCDIHNV